VNEPKYSNFVQFKKIVSINAQKDHIQVKLWFIITYLACDY